MRTQALLIIPPGMYINKFATFFVNTEKKRDFVTSYTVEKHAKNNSMFKMYSYVSGNLFFKKNPKKQARKDKYKQNITQQT